MIELVKNDYLDIEEKDLIESLIIWIKINVSNQIGESDDIGSQLGTMLWTDDKVNQKPFNSIIRYARMEHPDINELFEKNEYLKKYMNETERSKVSAAV